MPIEKVANSQSIIARKRGVAPDQQAEKGRIPLPGEPDVGGLRRRLPRREGHSGIRPRRHLGPGLSADARGSQVRHSQAQGKDRARGDPAVSTLTKYSAIPYTGPAPTNRESYEPAE